MSAYYGDLVALLLFFVLAFAMNETAIETRVCLTNLVVVYMLVTRSENK